MHTMKSRPIRSVVLASFLCFTGVQSPASVVDRHGDVVHDGTLSSAASLASKDTRLSIDAGLQKIVEEEVAQAQADFHAQKIIAILADPKTGEILVMACSPEPARGEPQAEQAGILARVLTRLAKHTSEPKVMRGPASEALLFDYEPGSIFMMVACAGFLKEGLGDEKIFCENGAFEFEGKTLRDHKLYGDLTPLEVLVKSSNIGSAKMALKLGKDKFRETAGDFGFGRKTGIALFDESPGIVLPMEKLDDQTLARMGFGQAVCVTPIHLIMAYAAIANGGLLLPPTLVLDPKAPLPKGDRILPEAIAGAIGKALMVDDMWALGRVEGLSVAGKAGTSQAVTPDGCYAEGQWITSFVGYFPAENPKVVCLVVVDQAQVAAELNYGGLTAAPIFSRIAAKAAAHLHITKP